MAEHAVVPPGLQLRLHRNVTQKQFFCPTYAHTRTRICASLTDLISYTYCLSAGIRREYHPRSCKLIHSHSLPSCRPTGCYRNLELHHLQGSSTKCYWLGALVNAENATTDWIPYVDQVLLLASIFLTYVAGVIPLGKPLADAHKSTLNDSTVPKNPSILGSAFENNNEDNLQFAWDIVKHKLLDSLYALKQAVNASNSVSGIDKDVALQRSSLFALAEVPRIRCLWASFQWLRKEVNDISGSPNDDFSMVFAHTIRNSFKDLCLDWLVEELCLKDESPKRALLSVMIDKLDGSDNILEFIRKSGKKDLYAELIRALRYGPAGIGTNLVL